MVFKRSNFFIDCKKHTQEKEGLARMIKGGFIEKHASGIYIWLNLGLRMLEKVKKIIKDELDAAGCLEILMPTVQDQALWDKTERSNSFGKEFLRFKDRNERNFLYGPTAEEVVTDLVSKFQIKKQEFPITLYNIQWKFRDEIRPRFGLLRAREFLMKDAYSFHQEESCLMKTYEKMFQAYSRIFEKLGISICTNEADTGEMGGFLSHEFQVKCKLGENQLEYDNWPNQPIQWNERDNAKIKESEDSKEKFTEIGHLFALGDKYTSKLGAVIRENGKPLLMGCYGIGISRIIGVLFENAEEKSLGKLAPFKYNILLIDKSDESLEALKQVNTKLEEDNEDILIDDREFASFGQKISEAKLIGSQIIIIIGKREASKNKIGIIKNNEEQTYEINDFLNWKL